MTIFIFLASDENGDRGLVITDDHALFFKAPYMTQAIWFVDFPHGQNTEPKMKRKILFSRDFLSW